MGWGSRSPRRDRRDYGRDEWRDDVAARGRSRSTSRDRHARRRSRSTSRRRARRDSRSPDGRYRRRSSSTSRSPERGRRHRSRSMSPPRRYRSSYSPPPDQHPPWHPGPGAEVVPPWRQQPPGHQPWLHPDCALPPAPVFYEGREVGSSRWDRPGRGSDPDREWSEERGRLAPGPGPGPGFDIPTASVFIKGLPYDADESDVHAVFAGFPNIMSIKVLRDRMTGRGKGTAFIDFESVDDARLLMESEARYSSVIGGQVLFLDYSSGPPGGGAGQGPAGGPALDWICDMCSSVNFARRLECYHCSSARPANPRRVTGDLNEPSNILKVSGLEPHTSEEALYQAMAAVGHNILDLRVIKDKYTGAPRGFAFVELPTVAAAGSLMLACQGMVLQGYSMPLKICYAKAKEQALGSATQAVPGAVPDAAAGPAAAVAAVAHPAAAKAAAGPLGWKPKEFNPDGSSKQEQQQQQAQTQPSAQAASSSEAAATGAAAAAPQAVAGPGPSSEAAAGSAAAAAAAGVDAATIQAMTQAGFEYQASSGYWWDAKSGYFYDANTQLYYHHSTNQWYQYNADTGQYTAVGGEQQQQQQQQQVQGQQQYSVAGDPAGAAAQQGQQQQPQQKQASAVDKRRRAVIGSAPQYNPEGLLAAAALAEEREAEQRRIAAAKAARERQQEQQNKHASKQPKLMQGKPGIGMLPGTGAGAAPPPAPVVPRLAQVVAEGDVQGVVYRSKWSQQRAAQQS